MVLALWMRYALGAFLRQSLSYLCVSIGISNMGNRLAVAEKVFWNCGLDVTTGGTVTPRPQFQNSSSATATLSPIRQLKKQTNKQKTIRLDQKNNKFAGESRPPFYKVSEHNTKIFFFFFKTWIRSFRIQPQKISPTFDKLNEIE